MNRRHFSLALLMVAATLLASAGPAQAVLVTSFNIQGRDMLASDIAGAQGVTHVGNWNLWNAQSGDTSRSWTTTYNADGVYTPITATATRNVIPGAYTGGLNDAGRCCETDGDRLLMRFGMDMGDSGALPGGTAGPALTINASNVPYALYDVYVYVKGKEGGIAQVTLNGSQVKTLQEVIGANNIPDPENGLNYVESTTTAFNGTAGQGHYVKFENVSGSSFSFDVATTWRTQPTGFQIVDKTGAVNPTPGSYAATVAGDNPLVWYRFEEAPGATTATDSSGNGNHGTYLNSPILGTASGFAGLGKAVGFDNGVSDDAVRVPALGTLNQFTIEAWVNPDTKQTFDTIYNTDAFPAGALHFQLRSNDALFTINKGGSNDVAFASGQIPDDAWTYLAATYDSNTDVVQLFLNGVLIQTTSFPGGVPAALTQGHIGAWLSGSLQREFHGLIDELAIYNRVLTAGEINEHYLARNSTAAAATPEPASVLLGLMGIAALARRRRRA